MALAIDFTEAVLSLTAHGSGLGDMARLSKRIERLARAAGRPFGVLLDLSDGRPADEAELTALLTLLLFELPDHGLRQLALVLDGPPEAFVHLAEELGADPALARAITTWKQHELALQHLRQALGIDGGLA